MQKDTVAALIKKLDARISEIKSNRNNLSLEEIKKDPLVIELANQIKELKAAITNEMTRLEPNVAAFQENDFFAAWYQAIMRGDLQAAAKNRVELTQAWNAELKNGTKL